VLISMLAQKELVAVRLPASLWVLIFSAGRFSISSTFLNKLIILFIVFCIYCFGLMHLLNCLYYLL
jgi:hypothetical protein